MLPVQLSPVRDSNTCRTDTVVLQLRLSLEMVCVRGVPNVGCQALACVKFKHLQSNMLADDQVVLDSWRQAEGLTAAT